MKAIDSSPRFTAIDGLVDPAIFVSFCSLLILDVGGLAAEGSGVGTYWAGAVFEGDFDFFIFFATFDFEFDFVADTFAAKRIEGCAIVRYIFIVDGDDDISFEDSCFFGGSTFGNV